MIENVIIMDFENISDLNLDNIKPNTKVILIIGLNQKSKQFEFTKKIIDSVISIEMIKVKGQGHNALDFFIAYYLGAYIHEDKAPKFTIYSNDQGYEPLIKHLSDSGVSVKRIESKVSPENNKKVEANTPNKNDKVMKKDMKISKSNNYDKVFENITGMAGNKRPKKLSSLKSHIKTALGKKINDIEVDEIVKKLNENNVLQIEEEKIKYIK